MNNLTREDIENWYKISQYVAGLTSDIFKPKEIETIQDFLETGKSDLLKLVNKNDSQS